MPYPPNLADGRETALPYPPNLADGRETALPYPPNQDTALPFPYKQRKPRIITSLSTPSSSATFGRYPHC